MSRSRTVNRPRPCDTAVMLIWVLVLIRNKTRAFSCHSWINETNSKTNSQSGCFLFSRLHSLSPFCLRPAKRLYWALSYLVHELGIFSKGVCLITESLSVLHHCYVCSFNSVKNKQWDLVIRIDLTLSLTSTKEYIASFCTLQR